MKTKVSDQPVKETSDHTLSRYEQWDPVSLRLLVDSVEAKARRMRAEAMHDMLRSIGGWLYRACSAAGRLARETARRCVQRATPRSSRTRRAPLET
jgi:hypothetical protein